MEGHYAVNTCVGESAVERTDTRFGITTTGTGGSICLVARASCQRASQPRSSNRPAHEPASCVRATPRRKRFVFSSVARLIMSRRGISWTLEPVHCLEAENTANARTVSTLYARLFRVPSLLLLVLGLSFPIAEIGPAENGYRTSAVERQSETNI